MSEPESNRELMRWLDALCSETITPEEQEQLAERLKEHPAARQTYLSYIDVHLGLRRLSLAPPAIGRSEPSEIGAEPVSAAARAPAGRSRVPAALAGLLVLAASLALLLWRPWEPASDLAVAPPEGTPHDTKPPDKRDPPPDSAVRLASTAGARFFGELVPPISSPLEIRRDYVLLAGMAELTFPTGATAIVEGPAVFRILSTASLGLDVGQCSVHCPPGAEGFRVETQQANVVDRGTRFSIKVSETSETEVHVVEGAADLYRAGTAPSPDAGASPEKDPQPLTRLNQHEARGLADDSQTIRKVEFSPAGYRQALPDRVISYEAKSEASGGATDLESVTVQRDGRPRTYRVEELIGVEPIWFRSNDMTDRNGHLTGLASLPAQRIDVLRDRSLLTGLINPGGSQQPLTRDPIMNLPEDPARPNTPGMAIRFAKPVVNGPGPDVVLFEMQTVTNPADGDAFHVSPLVFAEGLRSHTVRAFDIAMTSSEAKKLGGFHLYRFEAPVRSLEELQAAACHATPLRRNFRVLAVGIDLSRLGYPPGAAVPELFLQDAADDDHKCDPVFIGGLPE